MALILTEPFDNLTAWTLGSGGSILSGGQVGNYARLTGNTFQGWPYPVPSISNYVDLTFWWRCSAIGTIARTIVQLRSDTVSANEITLSSNASSALQILAGGTAGTPLGNSGAFTPALNTWYRLHLVVFVATAAGGGYVSLDVDGTNRINVTGVKTFLTTAQVASLWIESGSATNHDFDELVLYNAPLAVSGTGTGAVVFDGSGTATAFFPGVGTGAVVFDGSGTATAVLTVTATGAGAVVFAGSGTAVALLPVPATGTGAIVFAGASAVAVVVHATGTGAITFGGAQIWDLSIWAGEDQPRWKAFHHQSRWTVYTPAESRWEIPQPTPAPSRWQIGAPLMSNIAAVSREYVRIPVTVNIGGLAYNPTGDTVQMAFTQTMREPLPADFHPGSWETTGQGSYYALCLIGPGGTVQLTSGIWYVWVQVADSPEIPVKAAGTITIYP